MGEVRIKISESGRGEFLIEENGERVAWMNVSIHGGILTAIHTEVPEAWGGRGFGVAVVDAMVEYARKNGLKVLPTCPYVRVLFERHPERYADVWQKA